MPEAGGHQPADLVEAGGYEPTEAGGHLLSEAKCEYVA